MSREVSKTITSIFMVPTLGIDRKKLGDNEFINAYIKDALREVDYKDCIYLLFKPKNFDTFKEFLDEEYVRTDSIVDDYDYKDGYVVVVYKLNPKFKKDFDIVKTGKYSRTSKEFQELFPKVVKIMKGYLHRDEISLQYRIFNRTQDLIDFWENKLDVNLPEGQEVWYSFEEDHETLDLKKIQVEA